MDIPKEFLSKEFLSQFKTGEDVTAFMKELHTRVYEQMLEAEMDNHLGYEKHSNQGDHSGNSRNGSYRKQIQTEMGESVIQVPRDREGEFEPIVVPKHQSRGLSIERLVISLYAKGMSVADMSRKCRKYTVLTSLPPLSPLSPIKLARLQQSGKIVLWTVYI